MLTDGANDVLTALRRGHFDPASLSAIESLSADAFIDDMRKQYGVVFQERTVGTKREIGLAREVAFSMKPKKLRDSRFATIMLLPTVERCILIQRIRR